MLSKQKGFKFLRVKNKRNKSCLGERISFHFKSNDKIFDEIRKRSLASLTIFFLLLFFWQINFTLISKYSAYAATFIDC